MLNADVQFQGTAATTVLATPYHPEEVDSDRFGGPSGFTFAAWVRRAGYGPGSDVLFDFGTTIDGGPTGDRISLTFGAPGSSSASGASASLPFALL